MVRGYTAQVRALLAENGCVFDREVKGDHEISLCSGATRPVVVDGRIMSRHAANGVLKQAGLEARVR